MLPNNAWCAQVTLTPEANKITVFKRGTWNALRESIPHGGQIPPNSITGLNLEWKKAQKKERKKKISLTIKRIIPNIKPLRTFLECPPWNVLSRITSRHHIVAVNNKIIKDKTIKDISAYTNILTKPTTQVTTPIPVIIGQGEDLTIWKGWKNFSKN